MANLARYAEVVKRIIGEYAAIKPAYGETVASTIQYSRGFGTFC
jgi:hypothetical protein